MQNSLTSSLIFNWRVLMRKHSGMISKAIRVSDISVDIPHSMCI